MKDFIKNNKSIILICGFILFVAGIGGLFVNLGMSWYNSTLKPTEWIPNFVIPIVWTFVYVLFAIIFSILNKSNILSNNVIILGILNGFFNILWCLTFFAFNQLLLGVIIIIINLFLGIMLLYILSKNQQWFIKLLWIYPIWLAVATFLNVALWILN